MLQQFLEPQLFQNDIFGTVDFQQAGAPFSDVRIVQEYLNKHFSNRWIGRGRARLWAARSRDLTALDFLSLIS
jgi:hypothetical protein